MKTLIALALFLATTSAHAFVPTALHCKEVNSGIDNGYEAIFNVQMTKLSLSEQTIAGPRHLAMLNCSTDTNVVYCSEPGKADTGYIFSMKPNDKGVMQAVLSEESFVGAKKLADLTCRYLNPQR